MSLEVALDSFDEIPDSENGDGFCVGERILAEDEYYKVILLFASFTRAFSCHLDDSKSRITFFLRRSQD